MLVTPPNKLRLSVLACLTAFAASIPVACSHRTGALTGYWEGDASEGETLKFAMATLMPADGKPGSIYKPFPLFHLKRDGTFDVVMNGTHRITGTVAISGDTATFTPLTVNGATKSDLLQALSASKDTDQQKRRQAGQLFNPLKGRFDSSRNFLTISVEDWRPARMWDEKPETLVLHAFAPKQKVPKTTVSGAEQPFVGTWRSYAGGPAVPNATDAEKKVQADDDLKHGRFVLFLRSDNTFACDMVGESRGKWAVDGSNLVLFVEADENLFPAHKVVFTVLSDGKQLSTPGVREDTAYFRKADE